MTDRVERIPADWLEGRDVVLIELTDQWLWPPDLGIDWFTAFIAADARGISDEAILSLASGMLAHSCGHVSTWGPDCERMHHLFDQAYLEAAPPPIRRWRRTKWSEEIPFLMTSSLGDERLAYALWDAVYNAWPGVDGYYENRPANFAALVEPQFRDEVRGLLLDPERLEREAELDES